MEHEKPTVRTFRDLIAWQRAKALVIRIYRETELMPDQERFGLINQIRRAAVSVPSNIAEGHGRQSRPDYLKHLRVARGSLMELDTQYELAGDLEMLRLNVETLDLIRETDRVLQGRSLEEKSR